MKKLLLLLSIFIVLNVSAQSFNGVPISGNINEAVNKFKAKGFKFIKKDGNSYVFSGRVFNEVVEMYLLASPLTNQYVKCSIFFPESAWLSLKSDYTKYVELFVEKYGYHSGQIEKFIDPYYEGDGYELRALQLEKCVYGTYWVKDNVSMLIEISKYKQVKIVYENNKLMDVFQKELQRQQFDSY
jgi:hypothetical protein